MHVLKRPAHAPPGFLMCIKAIHSARLGKPSKRKPMKGMKCGAILILWELLRPERRRRGFRGFRTELVWVKCAVSDVNSTTLATAIRTTDRLHVCARCRLEEPRLSPRELLERAPFQRILPGGRRGPGTILPLCCCY
jgi:hypothetical protein